MHMLLQLIGTQQLHKTHSLWPHLQQKKYPARFSVVTGALKM